MRDVHELLREKESELGRVTQEVEALRLVVRLLAQNTGDAGKTTSSTMDKPQPAQTNRMKVFP